MDLLTIGPHLKQIRRSRQITQKALAEATGHSQSLIANIEDGRVQPSLRVLQLWLNFLKLKITVEDQ